MAENKSNQKAGRVLSAAKTAELGTLITKLQRQIASIMKLNRMMVAELRKHDIGARNLNIAEPVRQILDLFDGMPSGVTPAGLEAEIPSDVPYLSARQLAQILATLRYCQRRDIRLTESLHFRDTGLKPLNDKEVDELCELLNTE